MVNRGWLYLAVGLGVLAAALSLLLARVAEYLILHDDVWSEMASRGYSFEYFVSEIFAAGSGLLMPAAISLAILMAIVVVASRGGSNER